MSNKKINDFFNGRFFEIPKYQRGYAWEIRNVRDLFEDIQEAIESDSSHYIGTFVLSTANEGNNTYCIVDGQQRVATITMVINSIIQGLKKLDRNYYNRFYIKDEKYRLSLLGKDSLYFNELLSGRKRIPNNKSQKLMSEAYEEILNQMSSIKDKKAFLKAVEKLEMMEFIEKSEGDAIRIFQTVNDRGKPLSNMEKAKSLLIYFSNRYLDKKLDGEINEKFGEMFDLYDDIKQIGEDSEITLIRRVEFNEDDIMRYHFITFSGENYDPTANYVLNYLKRNLGELRKSERKNGFKKLHDFITSYVDDLNNFFKIFKDTIEKTKDDKKYFKIFSLLGISATLYPLLMKLGMMGILDKNLPDDSNHTFLDLIEIIDVRIYKTRGTDPRADISRFVHTIREQNMSAQKIRDWLLEYNQKWMSKEQFQVALGTDFYGNWALPHMYVDYCEHLVKKPYPIKTLKEIVTKKPTIEHILSQTPNFKFKSVNFKNEKEFLEYSELLGNLTILEKKLNSAVQNKNPLDKVSYYDKSLYKMTKKLSTSIANKKKFRKEDIISRNKELSQYLSDRWWC